MTAKRFKNCSVEGCEGNADRSAQGHRGYCVAHYYRLRKHGSPTAGRTPGKRKTPHGAHKKFIEETALHYEGEDCLIWPFYRASDGYGRVTCGGRPMTASRYICELVNGPPPEPSMDACHNCGKGHLGCVAPGHLRWDTRTGNFADKYRHGTHGGGKTRNAKLTAEDVQEIRRLARVKPQIEIAQRFGVDSSAISSIVIGRTWAWLPWPIT